MTPPICQLCGQPTDGATRCWGCRHTPLAIDGIRSVVLFESGVRQAIHQLKYRNRQLLAVPLARVMADAWCANPLPIDLITWVPLHPARHRERGYNQADLLARAFARMIDMPVGTAGLKRVRRTQSQMSLSAVDRRENVRGAFHADAPRGAASASVSNRRVLIIDDVCTTGSTLEACSIALKGKGAVSVWGFTLARTNYLEDQ